MQDALVVPEQAIVPQGDEQFVFRVVDGKAVRSKVIVGQRREGKVEIVQGLTAADTVVTAGQMKIRDGTLVAVARSAAPLPAKAEGPPPPPAKS
jgi:membrane fusion protein (multidrug efflux system)